MMLWGGHTPGGVLSPLHFNLALKEIHKYLPPEVSLLQFADDILFYCRSEDVNEALSILEGAYRCLSAWLQSLGLSLAPEKSQLCVFDRRSDFNPDLSIELEGNSIANSRTLLYLGIPLDTRLSWEDHIDFIISKAAACVNVLRMLARASGGTCPETVLLVYKGLTRAILEWGAILFAGAAKNQLKRLDTQQYASLRIILGCMRSTPIPIILVEAKGNFIVEKRDHSE